MALMGENESFKFYCDNGESHTYKTYKKCKVQSSDRAADKLMCYNGSL